MIRRPHRFGRGVFALACAIVVALAFAMPTNAATDCDIKGTKKGETIVGTDKAEVICGVGGNDVIYGKGGDDTLRGGAGRDQLYGGSGHDRLVGGTGDDQLYGGAGDDRLIGGAGTDQLRGGRGNDGLYGGIGDDSLIGGNGADTLSGYKGADRLMGMSGDDTLRGGAGDDTIAGGQGADVARGGIGDDRLLGGDGNDSLAGDAGDDRAHGDAGDDTVRGGTGGDELYGGLGGDRVYGDDGADRLFGGDGNDYLHGGRDGDRLYGGAGNDELRGSDGNDLIRGSTGNDEVHGGTGNDTLHGDAGKDTIRGSSGNDVLYGGSQRDVMYGGTGADRLVGGEGQDRLFGLQGNDRLISKDGMKDVVRGGLGRDGCNEDSKDDLRGVEYVIGQGAVDPGDRDRGGAITIVRPSEPTTRGIVSTVTGAPTVSDGDVAGATTHIFIDLDRSLDPAVAGRTLSAGDTIRVTLPDDFGSSDLPTNGPVTCDTSTNACNTGVLVGVPWARPEAPERATYAVQLMGERTIVFTALEDLGPGDLPGIKQVHLSLPGFTNPQAGAYGVEIEAETGPDGAVEMGTAVLTVYPSIQPSINATNVFVAGDGHVLSDVVYQETFTNTPAPIAWDFLLWEAGGVPAIGVELEQRDERGGAILQDGRSIGSFAIEAPRGAQGQSVTSEPSVLSDVPGAVGKAGRLTASFTAGDTPGIYVTTFELDDGNSQQMRVEVD
jgi:Ca2+-binding RTX toxin-like protein